MSQVVRPIWNELSADTQITRDALSIRKQPCLNGSNRNAKAHVGGRLWQPPSRTRRGTGTVAIQVDENYPWRKSSRVVVSGQALQEFRLALSPMDIAQPQADVQENTLQNRFIDDSLNGAGNHNLPVRHALVSKKRELLGLRGTRVWK